MHSNQRSTKALVGFSLSFFSLAMAFADSDGYFSTAWGAKAKGLAGVSISLRHDALMIANNPAGTIGLGRRFDIGLSLFSPDRSYDVTGTPTGTGSFMPGAVKSRLNYFLIPDFGVLYPQKDGSVLGFAFYGNGGMNTAWPESANGGFGVYGGGRAGVNLSQMFLSGSYAREVGKGTSLGLALLFGYQTFAADGLNPFNPASTTLSNNGADSSTGIGFKLGLQQDLTPQTRLGLVYQPKMKMSRFKKYSGLFAGGGNFDIPENYGIGVSHKINEKSTVALEMKTIKYGSVPSIANPMSNIVNGLGSANGPGFGWRDMTIYKLGYEWEAATDLYGRVGISYGRQPIPSTEMMFNILAPGVVEWHYSVGLTKVLRDGELTFAFTLTPNKRITGPNPNDPTQTIGLSMKQWELAIGYSKKF